jgi:hypothetical protein
VDRVDGRGRRVQLEEGLDRAHTCAGSGGAPRSAGEDAGDLAVVLETRRRSEGIRKPSPPRRRRSTIPGISPASASSSRNRCSRRSSAATIARVPVERRLAGAPSGASRIPTERPCTERVPESISAGRLGARDGAPRAHGFSVPRERPSVPPASDPGCPRRGPRCAALDLDRDAACGKSAIGDAAPLLHVPASAAIAHLDARHRSHAALVDRIEGSGGLESPSRIHLDAQRELGTRTEDVEDISAKAASSRASRRAARVCSRPAYVGARGRSSESSLVCTEVE